MRINAIRKIKVSPACPIIALAVFFTTTQKILFLYNLLIYSKLLDYKGKGKYTLFEKSGAIAAEKQKIEVVDNFTMT